MYSIENDFVEVCNMRGGKNQNLSYSSNDVAWSTLDNNLVIFFKFKSTKHFLLIFKYFYNSWPLLLQMALFLSGTYQNLVDKNNCMFTTIMNGRHIL